MPGRRGQGITMAGLAPLQWQLLYMYHDCLGLSSAPHHACSVLLLVCVCVHVCVCMCVCIVKMSVYMCMCEYVSFWNFHPVVA